MSLSLKRKNTSNDKIIIKNPSLVLLVGASSSGKTTFAKKNFLPTQIVSSDGCRATICDSENDMSALGDGFELLKYSVKMRLKHKKLTVIDATNTRLEDRAIYIKMAQEHNIPVVAIVLDLPLETCLKHALTRTDRGCSLHKIVSRQHAQLNNSLNKVKTEEGLDVHTLRTPEQVRKQIIELDFKVWR